MNHLQIGLIIEQSVPCRAQRSSATAVVPANNAGDETLYTRVGIPSSILPRDEGNRPLPTRSKRAILASKPPER